MTTKMVLAGLALLAVQAFAQIPAALRFLAADVHASPPQRYPFFQQMPVYADHYILKGPSMVDLIATAYGVDVLDVQGGPSWLERERYDVTALTPPKASKDQIKLMLRALLAERFNLVVHTGTKDVPAYVLSLGKDKPRMKASTDPDAQVGCEFKGTDAPNSYIDFHCHNMSMAGFLNNLHDWAGDYLKLPVTDATDLKGGWDFDIKWTGKNGLAAAGADAIPIFEAVEKQLGLKLEMKTTPRIVIIVDSVNRTPTPNAPDLDQILPPVPKVTLEVATIKPGKPGDEMRFMITPDSMNLRHASLRELIHVGWDLNNNDKEIPVNAPKWLDQDSFDVVAKIGADAVTGAPPLIPISEFRRLLREMLADRFHLKTHMEELPMNGYKLVAVSPKLKPANPDSRTHCNRESGPSADNPILSQVFTCQNITMAQFGEELASIANGYIYAPVLDATGLKGGWDFTLSFSTAQQVNAEADQNGSGNASTPTGAVSLFDAIAKQLGLKLEKDRRPMPVLVIDHVDEKPTEN